jgi:protease I
MATVRALKITSYEPIRTDVKNAGGNCVDQEVVIDGGTIIIRSLVDLLAFMPKIIEEVQGGAPVQR